MTTAARSTATRALLAAALAVGLALGAAACDPDGTEDMSPGAPETVPGEPGDPADDLPEDMGEEDL
jgi:hypothetical protein